MSEKKSRTYQEARDGKLDDIRTRISELTHEYVILAKIGDRDYVGRWRKGLWREVSDDMWAIGALTVLLDDLRENR